MKDTSSAAAIWDSGGVSAAGVDDVTFLFTDVEGFTRLWQDHPGAMETALETHDRLISRAIEANGGRIFSTAGDSFAAAFATPDLAVAAAIESQRALDLEEWGEVPPLRVRMGIHTGPAHGRAGSFYGPQVNLAARVMAAAHGSQVLLTQSSADLVTVARLNDLGFHRLRDIEELQHIHQLAADGLASDFPPIRAADAFRSTLPAQRSAFIGRQDDIAAVSRLLLEARLVTLTGVGGCGKTRLAIEVAARELGHHEDGVFFVDLAPLSEAGQVPQAFLRGCGLPVDAATEPSDQVVGHLEPKEVLLVVDNCEHLIDDVALMLDKVLSSCPRVDVIATSREPVEIEGERTYRVPSLQSGSLDGPAERLFMDRAVSANPSLKLGDADAGVITEICGRLDGIPLAIELAAARSRVYSPNEIRDRLQDRFSLLVGGRRRGVRRQQTLEAAIDWSYDLLSEAEKAMFRSAAVFNGSFDLAAAAHVYDSGEDTALALVEALVDRSMIAAEVGVGSTRFRLLETLRGYGLQKLVDAGEAVVARDRHRDHYLLRFEVPRLADPHCVFSMNFHRLLLAELDNLLAALEWCADQGRRDAIASLVWSMGEFWVSNGYEHDGLRWAQEALRDDSLDDDTRGVLLLIRAWTAVYMAAPGFPVYASEAVVFAEEHPHRYRSIVHVWAAGMYCSLGEPALAEEAAEKAVEAAQDSPLPEVARAYAVMARGPARVLARDAESALPDLCRGYEVMYQHDSSSEFCVFGGLNKASCLHLLDRNAEAAAVLKDLRKMEAIIPASWRLRIAFLDAVVAGARDDAGARARFVEEMRSLLNPESLADVAIGLIGLGILAYQGGEQDRARSLLAPPAFATDANWAQVFWHYLAAAWSWPEDEFEDRRRAEVIARFPGLQTGELRTFGRQKLVEEMTRIEDQI